MYLIRHGETIWNRAKRLQGRKDSPLSLRGIDQARAIGAALAARLDDPAAVEITASPLGRTRRTAAIIAECLDRNPNAVAIDPDLREITFGDWDGLTFEQIEAAAPGALAAREASKWTYQPPNGESYAALARRMALWLDHNPPRGARVIVAHGAVIRMLRGLHGRLGEDEILFLDEPQDAYFRFHEDGIERIIVG